jgi:hypothetical protein
VDFGLELVAMTLPGGNRFAQDLDMGDTTIQTLTGQHRQFALRAALVYLDSESAGISGALR